MSIEQVSGQSSARQLDATQHTLHVEVMDAIEAGTSEELLDITATILTGF